MTYHSDRKYQSDKEVVDAALSISLVPVRLALGILKDATAVELAKPEFKGGESLDFTYHRLVRPLESELGIVPAYNKVELTDADRAAVATAAIVSKGAVQDALDVLRTYAAAEDDDKLLAQMDYQRLVRMFKEGAGIQTLADRFHAGIILTRKKDDGFDEFPYFQKELPQRGRFSESNTQPNKQPVTFFEKSPPKEEKEYKPFMDLPPKTELGTAPNPSRFYDDLLRELSRIPSSDLSLLVDPSLSNNTPPLRPKIPIIPDSATDEDLLRKWGGRAILEHSKSKRDVPVIKIPLDFSDKFSYLRPKKESDTDRLGQSEWERLLSGLKPKDK